MKEMSGVELTVEATYLTGSPCKLLCGSNQANFVGVAVPVKSQSSPFHRSIPPFQSTESKHPMMNMHVLHIYIHHVLDTTTTVRGWLIFFCVYTTYVYFSWAATV